MAMFFVWIVLLIPVIVKGWKCDPCPDGCSCERYLDCSGRSLTEAHGHCQNGTIERIDFSDNRITSVNWENIPQVSGLHCHLNFQNNSINESLGVYVLKWCRRLHHDLSNNNLKTLPSNFFVVFGKISSLEITLKHNSLIDIMPRAVRNFNNSRVIRFLNVDLSFNKVSYIHPGAFDADVHSFKIVLKNNNLVSFSVLDAWKFVTLTPSSLLLNLVDNLLEDLEVEDEDHEIGFSYDDIRVKLRNNPWNCDCKHKSIASNNSNLRKLLKRPSLSHPTCSTPDIVRNVPVMSLSPDDFVCPPQLESPADVKNIVIHPGENVTLVCPVTFADPPITGYDWTFFPKLSSTQRKLIGAELWDVRSTRRTIANYVQADILLEGVYECLAANPFGKLAVNISVSFP